MDIVKDILRIALTAFVSLAVLFALAQIMGNRQMSQLSMFDYINGITIGSIAAEFATSLRGEWTSPLIAMVVYALAAVSISTLSEKSVVFRRLTGGRPLLLMQDNQFYWKNLRKAHLDITEFLSLARIQGYYDLSAIEAAVFEPNGHISFMTKSARRPLQPMDMNMEPPKSCVPCVAVMDGQLLRENLTSMGKDEVWLYNELRRMGFPLLEPLALALICDDGSVSVYGKIDSKPLDRLI